MRVGYRRVSSIEQNTARQLDGVQLDRVYTDKAATLKSMDKFEALAKQTGAKVIIQHEPADVGKLPVFPRVAE